MTRKLRLHIFSDIHLEFGNSPVRPVEADLVIAAGDIGPGLAGAQWLMRTFTQPVVYVIGNHEPYNRVLEDFEDALEKKCAGSNVLYCRHPGRRIDMGDVRILGTTLWSDYQLWGDAESAMRLAQREMTDYFRIRVRSSARRFSGVPLRPSYLLERHRSERAWLERELAEPWLGRTVVVTHHSMTPATLEYQGTDPLDPCYASNLEAILDVDSTERPAVDLAVHGHVHVRRDLVVRRTRVVVNARGYARLNYLVEEFDPALIVEI